MSLSEIEIFGPEVERARFLVEKRLEACLQFGAGCPVRLADAIRYSLLSPGKRLRPLLVLAAAHVCGSDIENAMPAACAVEMIHCYSLIHDDLPVMDDDDMRRGQPSCHAAFDEATAILAGDALIPLAFEVLARDIRPIESAVRCIQELAAAAGAAQLVGGQSDDLQLQNTEISLTELEGIHRRKTGALFVVSLRMGCICAQGTPEQLESLSEFGKHLGLAFQITDDLLDLCGEEVKIGKRVGKDSGRGKRTWPGLMGIDASWECAAQASRDAIQSLACFGDIADDLRRLAAFVMNRNS